MCLRGLIHSNRNSNMLVRCSGVLAINSLVSCSVFRAQDLTCFVSFADVYRACIIDMHYTRCLRSCLRALCARPSRRRLVRRNVASSTHASRVKRHAIHYTVVTQRSCLTHIRKLCSNRMQVFNTYSEH